MTPEYEEFVNSRVFIDPDTPRERLLLGALGLAGETGEVVEIIKKYAINEGELCRDSLLLEIGDVCWYLTLLFSHASLRCPPHTNCTPTEYGTNPNKKCLLLGATELVVDSGKVVEMIKKHAMHGKEMNYDKLLMDLSNIYFCLVLIIREMGFTLDEILSENIKKLTKRSDSHYRPEHE